MNNATPVPSDVSSSFEVDGLVFRDLDHDGILAIYEDHRVPDVQRTDDLLARMTLEEKVGLMFHGTATAVGSELAHIGIGREYDLDAMSTLINSKGVNSLISRLSLPAADLAAQSNALQAIAAKGRLGIPVTISTDPRNHFTTVTGASVNAAGFSQWPETLGLAAIGDSEVVRRFAEVVRQEYRAVGFHVALSPQADLATSPRWPRTEGTFGEDPTLVRRLVGAYVEGMQNGTTGLGPTSVATVVKHWVGYGASRDGFDGHNFYGRYSAFPGGAFDDHVSAFLDAFANGVAGVMPTYNICEGVTLNGEELEQVGAGFNRQLLLGLLRGVHGYQGLILSDWSITKDITESARTGNPPQTPALIAMPWGVEDLSRVEKFAKGVNAGLDQFGGENDPAALLDAVHSGLVTEERINESARRILMQKFELGLFDNPFVDVEAASEIVGRADFKSEADGAQRRSLVWLKRTPDNAVKSSDTVYVSGIDASAFTLAGIATTTNPEEATVAIVRVSAPHQVLHPNHFFGRMQNEGDLDFKEGDSDLDLIGRLSASLPTLVIARLDRPAILTNIVDHAAAIVAEFGASPEAVVDVLMGNASAEGRLPFQLPRSMEAVLAQTCDRANDGVAPLFPLFHRAG